MHCGWASSEAAVLNRMLPCPEGSVSVLDNEEEGYEGVVGHLVAAVVAALSSLDNFFDFDVG